MIIKITYPNLLHSCNFLCFLSMNYSWVWEQVVLHGCDNYHSLKLRNKHFWLWWLACTQKSSTWSFNVQYMLSQKVSLDIFLFTKVSLILCHPPGFWKCNIHIKMCWCFLLFYCFFSQLSFLFNLLLSSFLCTKSSRIHLKGEFQNLFNHPVNKLSVIMNMAINTLLD